MLALMVDYNSMKAALSKNGEVMIRLDTGEKIELHTHNVKFHDDVKEVEVDASSETFWIPSEKIAYYWIHREGIEGK